MLLVAARRLWSRPFLTLLSIAGVTLAIGLVAGIPLFSQAVSFVVLNGELGEISADSGRPPVSLRVYASPGNQYPLSMERARTWERHIQEAIVAEAGLPLTASRLYLETKGLVLYTREAGSPYGGAEGAGEVLLRRDLYLAVSPGIAPHMDVVEGAEMDAPPGSADRLEVWLHKRAADEMGVGVGETFEIRDTGQGRVVPIQIAGVWQAADPGDAFWFSNPDLGLRNRLMVREADYLDTIEPLFNKQVGFASWYLILDEQPLSSDKVEQYAEGFERAFETIGKFVPDGRVDGSPLEALIRASERKRNLTALLLVFSVPLMGFLLYFLALVSTITLRWQRRETAIMVSRGLRGRQLLAVGAIEAAVIVGAGCALGVLVARGLAQLMGYTQSFMAFTWREPLPLSRTAVSVPLLAVVVLATMIARLWPLMRASGTGVVSHERRRARAPERPFWQRAYLDFLLLIPVIYAYRRLAQSGTLVPDAWAAPEPTSWLATRAPEFLRDVVELLRGAQDPLLFLVPALFALTGSLLLVRLFPLLMRIGDWLGGLGNESTFYLAFRQLARQSSQYTSALLLVISSLSLGAFMASMAVSLDRWLSDRVRYAVGSDVYIKQLPDPGVEDVAELSPSQGAWVLPVTDYLDVPGVVAAARVGRYPASVTLSNNRIVKCTYIGIDRQDVADVAFYRPEFGPSLGQLMNQLAIREDGIILSETLAREQNYEIGDKIPVRLSLWFGLMSLKAEFTLVDTFKYFPTVYEDRDQQPAMIGNLDYVYQQIGAVLIHDIWLRIDPALSADNAPDQSAMMEAVQEMGVYVHRWVDIRDEMQIEQARVERVGIFGTLTIGFLAAAVLSGIGLMVYNYASLQERLFRFTILRAVGLRLAQIIGQVAIEYVVLMVYGVAGGAAIGAWASELFIPFFQATDRSVLNPPMLMPLVAWDEIGRISAVFCAVLIVVQVAVMAAALRRGVFQALRMGDRELADPSALFADRRAQAVPDSPHCAQKARVAGLVLDLFPEPAYVHVQGARVAHIVGVPHRGHQKLARQRLPGVLHKDLQEQSLLGGQPGDPVAALRAARLQVERQVPHTKNAALAVIEQLDHAIDHPACGKRHLQDVAACEALAFGADVGLLVDEQNARGVGQEPLKGLGVRHARPPAGHVNDGEPDGGQVDLLKTERVVKLCHSIQV